MIDQFLTTPFNAEGKKVSSLLRKKRRRRRRAPSPESEEDAAQEYDEPRKKRKEKKKKEKEQYKSAQFIQDSDEEYGDMDSFLEKEKVLRDRAALAGAAAASEAIRPPGMRMHGMKKRRRKDKASAPVSEPTRKQRTLALSGSSSSDENNDKGSSSSEAKANESDNGDLGVSRPSRKTYSERPASSSPALPRPRYHARTGELTLQPLTPESGDDSLPKQRPEAQSKTRRLIVLSDEEE